jgi:hypothetical protein
MFARDEGLVSILYRLEAPSHRPAKSSSWLKHAKPTGGSGLVVAFLKLRGNVAASVAAIHPGKSETSIRRAILSMLWSGEAFTEPHLFRPS